MDKQPNMLEEAVKGLDANLRNLDHIQKAMGRHGHLREGKVVSQDCILDTMVIESWSSTPQLPPTWLLMAARPQREVGAIRGAFTLSWSRPTF